MRPTCVLLWLTLACCAANAQTQYPTTTAPQPVWGGVALPAQVPYQPTLMPDGTGIVPQSSPASPGTAAIPSTTTPPAGQVWQPYPPPQNTFPGGSYQVPPSAPYFADPIHPAMPEPSLRQSLIPPDARQGFFQKAKFTATWIPQLENDSLGWTDLRSEVVTALPFFTRENPIIITPSYELHFLDGPAGLDLPPRLHDLAIDFHVFRVFGNHWIADFAVTPGLYADDHSFDSEEAFRINGRAVGVYAPTINVKWVFGVTYIDGGWAKIVPIAGVIYEPADDVKYELLFPQPRVAWRLANSPVLGRDEYWTYIKGEFGNLAWAFQQPDGTPDVLASRDWRLIVGLERKVISGLSYRAEVGYVFNRDLKIASNGPNDISLDNAILLRAGVTY